MANAPSEHSFPRSNPDGAANPVLASVLQGEVYIGRAFVVDGWYATGYRPLKMLKAALLECALPAFPKRKPRKAILDTRVGQTGYVWVINAKGNTRGKYVISPQAKKDGQPLSGGNAAIEASVTEPLLKVASSLRPGEVGEYRYIFQAEGESQPAMHLARLVYYAPWDWVVGISQREDEALVTAMNVKQAIRRSETTQWIVIGTALLAAGILWQGVARRLTGKLDKAVHQLNEESQQLTSASRQIAAASQTIAGGASTQAASLEETSRGFAVVAQEVRALAARSAEAAKNTADMIEESMRRARGGGAIAAEASQALDKIDSGANQVHGLAAEMVTATHEHAQGVAQITRTIAEMDQVTQSAAASAEESASSARELAGHATNVHKVVETLSELVRGGSAAAS